MKNLTDRVELTNRWVRNMVDVSMIGEKFGPGKYDYRRFIHRQGGPDGVKTALRSLSEKELKETMVPWLSNNGKRDLVRTDFATDRSYEAFNSIQATFDRALAIVNSLRAKFEMSPIPRIPGFFPRSRANGDYRLTVADQAGDIKQLLTFKTLGEAKEQYVYLKEKFPYLRFDNPRKEQGPYHREPYKTRETETSVLVEALRINSKDDAVTKLITQAINERILKRGAGGHFLKRKEGDVVGGYLGENLEVNDIIQGIESYHELLYTNAGNLQKRLIQQELNDLKIGDKLFSQMAPNAYSYLTQYLNKARGASNLLDQSETIFAGKVSQALGYGASGAERAMQSIASGAMMWYLTKMPFFGSQFFQPFNALAKMIDVAQTYSGKGLVGSAFETTKAFMLGYQNTIYPKIDGRNVVNWAIKAGYIDPMMAHLLDPASDVSAARKSFTKTSGTIEREVVRIPVLLGFNELLKNIIKNPEKRYEVASELMSRTMAMTSRSNAPMIWDRFGIVGTAMKSLKSYSTNIWGQFSEFLEKAVNKQQYAPLATFLGTQLAIGGIQGVIGVAEVTGVINLWNNWTNSNIKTPLEWFLLYGDELFGKGLNETLSFGGASTILGRDISMQVGNPAGFNYFDPIPLKPLANMVMEGGTFVKEALEGTLTDTQKLKTLQTFTPPAMKEMGRHLFEKQGQPVPNAAFGMKGTYYRTPEERLTAVASGTRSIDESKADTLEYMKEANRRHVEGRRSALLNSLTDDYLAGRSPSQSKQDEYIKSGGNMFTLSRDIIKTMKERGMTKQMGEQMMKKPTTAGLKKLQEAQPYLKAMPSNTQPPKREWKIKE